MQQHLDQASHNQAFHDCIVENFNDKFYDWKITVLFYIAIHCLKALAIKRNATIGVTHAEIEKSVNPDRQDATMKISRNAWREYRNLYNYSRTARYEGITDTETFEKLKQLDHSYCIKHLDSFKKYIIGQGINI